MQVEVYDTLDLENLRRESYADDILADIQAAACVGADVLGEPLLDLLDAVQREGIVGLEVEHLHPDIHRCGTAETDILDVPGSVHHRNGHVAIGLDARALPAVDGLGNLLIQPSVHHQLNGVGR